MNKFQNIVQKCIKKLFKRGKPKFIHFYPSLHKLSYNKLNVIAKGMETPVERYTKSELARMYRKTVQTFMTWVQNNKPLRQELERTGYKKSVKEFTKEQVLLIFTYLGEP